MKVKVMYNGKKIEVEKGTKVLNLFAKEILDSNFSIIACKFNNEVKSLDYEITESGTLMLLDGTTKDGKRVYIRGLTYILSKAMYELNKDAIVNILHQVATAMICEVDNMKITDEDILKLKEKMIRIVYRNLSIKKEVISKQETNKIDEKEQAAIYYCEDFYTSFFGVLPISTGFIKLFDIAKFGKNIIIRYPTRLHPDSLGKFIEKPKMLKTLEEYDEIHRVLNVNTVYKLNKVIKENNIKDTVLVDEALHEKKIAAIADEIAARKGVKVVLIAGPSSSGKTTFAKRLGIQLRVNNLKPVTISVDNYFVERKDTPKDEDGKMNFEDIKAVDIKLLNEHIQKLIKGETIKKPTFDFLVGTKKYNGETMHLAEDEVLIMEGIHCLNDELTYSIPKEAKFKIYINDLTVLNIDYFNRISTTDVRLIRRIVRDYKYRGYSALHTLNMWDSVIKGESKYIYPFQETADAMFNTSLVYELGILKTLAMPLLAKIDEKNAEFSEAKRLYKILEHFEEISEEYVPNQSILREFIGGSIFGE